MRYIFMIIALFGAFAVQGQTMKYIFETNNCFLDVKKVVNNDTVRAFNFTLIDLTVREVGDDDLDISSGGDADDMTVDVDYIPQFTDRADAINWLDSVRAVCGFTPGSAGFPIVSDTAGVLIIDSVTVQIDTVTLNVTMVDSSTVTFNDNSLDAFARLRVSDPFTLFDSKQIVDMQPLFWDTAFVNNGAFGYQVEDSESVLSVAGASDAAIKQTKMRFNYQPGKSQLILITFNAYGRDDNVTKRIGYFNSDTISPYTGNFDGLYLELSDSVYLCQAKNGTAECVSQVNWNVDPMNGTGPSGVTIDWNTTQIYFSDFEWLGVGRTRHGFNIDGIPYYAHEFLNANNKESVYMQTPNHSIRYEIRSSGGADSMAAICSSVISEGGLNPLGTIFSANTGVDYVATGAANEILIGIRLKPGQYMSTIDVLYNNVLAGTNDNIFWQLCLNPTYANAVTWTNIDNSPIQYGRSTGEDGTVSDLGTVLYSGYASNQVRGETFEVENALRLGTTIDGVRDEIWLIVRDVAGSAANIVGSITFRVL